MANRDELMRLAAKWRAENGDYPESKRDCADELERALAQRAPLHGAVPEGWQLVPCEPNDTMIEAGCAANVDMANWPADFGAVAKRIRRKNMRAAWAALLAAAPAPEAAANVAKDLRECTDAHPVRPCNMGVGCEEAGVCYAKANGHTGRCGKLDAQAELLHAINVIDDFVARCEGNDCGSDHVINGIRDYINKAFAPTTPEESPCA